MNPRKAARQMMNARIAGHDASKFQKGSGVFTCRICKKKTRATFDRSAADIELCMPCYEAAGLENQHSDDGHEGPAADCPICYPEKAQAARTGEAEVPKFNPPPSFFTPADCEARAAMQRAFFLAGAAGANANINHPMRPAWEALRAYFDTFPA